MTGFIQRIKNFIDNNRSATAATAIGAAISATDLGTTTTAFAADLSGIKQSCNDAGRALLGTAKVDVTNSYTVQQNLVNYWNGVGDTARASEAGHIQGGQWNAKAKRYEHADFIGLQAALSEAQADFASRDQSCKAPAPEAQAELPQFVPPNLTLEPVVRVGVSHKTHDGKSGSAGYELNSGFVEGQLNVKAPLTDNVTVYAGPHAVLFGKGDVNLNDAALESAFPDITATGHAFGGHGGIEVKVPDSAVSFAIEGGLEKRKQVTEIPGYADQKADGNFATVTGVARYNLQNAEGQDVGSIGLGATRAEGIGDTDASDTRGFVEGTLKF